MLFIIMVIMRVNIRYTVHKGARHCELSKIYNGITAISKPFICVYTHIITVLAHCCKFQGSNVQDSPLDEGNE